MAAVRPRRLKRTSDSEWRVETLSYLTACTVEIAALQARQVELLLLAREAGNPAWLLASAAGVSRSQLYRMMGRG